MKVIIRCLCPNGCTQEVEIDACCGVISIDPPPPPPGRSFDFESPGGEASGDGYRLSRVLQEFSAYGVSASDLTPVGAVPSFGSVTYGVIAPRFVTFPENCAPGEFPTAELYSNDIWHTTVAFLRAPDGRIFLIPAYDTVYLPEDTVSISMGLPVCTL